jgi:hypothetical protein
LAIAFLGPTLPAPEARQLFPRAAVLGPARQGDVLRALRERPRAIVLIDGVFESQRSVWHQEIRIALSEGVHVLGASSMGALRAVELSPFGMIGVGAVYRAYAEGRLTDDADVALLHASAEHGHRALTVPFVNVVATAEHALENGRLSLAEARALVRAARQVHYQDRHWPHVLQRLRWSSALTQRFEAHRKAHPQDVKASDARACLTAARALCASDVPAAAARLDTLSVWARRAWIQEQGTPPAGSDESGLRVLMLAEWARSLGVEPAAERVAFFERTGGKLGLDAGLLRRFAEALALDEQALSHPELLLAQAPSRRDGAWVNAIVPVRGDDASRRRGRSRAQARRAR